MRRLIILSVLTVYHLSAFTQEAPLQSSDSSDASQLTTLRANYAKVWDYLDARQYEEALTFSLSFLDTAALHDPVLAQGMAECYYTAAKIYRKKQDYSNFIEMAKVGLLAPEGHIKQATRARLMDQVAAGYTEMRQYDRAVSWSKKAIAAAEAIDSAAQQSALLFNAYQLLGLNYMELLDNGRAQSNFMHSLEYIDRQSTGKVVKANVNLGLLFDRSGMYDSAVSRYHVALKATTNVNHKSIIHSNLAAVFDSKKDYEKVAFHLTQSLQYLQELVPQDHPIYIETAMSRAWAIGMKGGMDQSETLLQAINGQTAEMNDFPESIRYQGVIFLNEIYYHNGKLEQAIEGFEQLLEVIPSVDFNGVKVYENIDNTQQALNIISYLLNCLVDSGSEKLRPVCDKLYDEMMVQNEYQALHTDSESLQSHIKIILGQLVRYYATQLNTGDAPIAQQKIWNILEISKSRKIQEHKNFMASLDSFSKEVFEEQKTIRDSLVLMKQVASQDEGQKKRRYQLEERLAQVTGQIKQEHPEYFDVQYEHKILPLADFTENLAPQQAAFSFFDDETALFILKLTREGFELTEYPIGEESLETVSSRALIDQLDATDQSVLIIPDGGVWNVDFSQIAYVTDSTNYLVERAPVSYAFSGTTLFEGTQPPIADNLSVLAFAYGEDSSPQFENTSLAMFRDAAYNDLPGSLFEIRQISEVMDGEFLKGSFSGEQQFREKSRDHDILHLAIHGEVNERNPENSSLVFYDAGQHDDGRLFAYELYNMNLNAKLAVLSACNTGSGQLRTGEGVQSLGRAFAFAGVPSLLLTRNKVSDLSTPYIMKYFYEGLSAGQRKSEALRNAQIKYLANHADNITSDPKYWSAFYVLGDDSPIMKEAGIWKNQLLGVFLLLVLLIAGVSWFYLRRARTS